MGQTGVVMEVGRVHDEAHNKLNTPERPNYFATLQRTVARSLLPIGMICFAVSLPYYIVGDGRGRFRELQALLDHGTLSTGRYSLIGPLFATPLYLLGKSLISPEAGVALFNVLVFLLGLLALRSLLRPWMSERMLRSFLLLLLVGSMFPASAASFYGETFTAVCVAVGLSSVVVARCLKNTVGWVAVTIGVANTPATVVALGIVLLDRIWQSRRWRYLVIGVGAVVLILGESLLRRGSIFATGYTGDHGPVSFMPFSGKPGFSYPLLFGLMATFLSFGKGLIFYTPGLFLPVRQRLTTLGAVGKPLATIYRMWALFVVGLVIAYVKWWAWSGDWFWGPRFFLIACFPASFALALWTQHPSQKLLSNLLALGTLALSLWVGIDSAVFSTSNLLICQANNYQFIALCQFTPEYSPLWRPLTALYQLGFTWRYAAAELTSPTGGIFAVFALVAGLYIAFPLLQTVRRQALALLPDRAVAWSMVRTGWRW